MSLLKDGCVEAFLVGLTCRMIKGCLHVLAHVYISNAEYVCNRLLRLPVNPRGRWRTSCLRTERCAQVLDVCIVHSLFRKINLMDVCEK